MQVSTHSPVSVGLLFGSANTAAESSDLVMAHAEGQPVARYHLENAWPSAKANTWDQFGAPPDLSRSTTDLSQ